MENKPRILVLATGEKEPGKGGSGFQELVEFTRTTPQCSMRKLKKRKKRKGWLTRK